VTPIKSAANAFAAASCSVISAYLEIGVLRGAVEVDDAGVEAPDVAAEGESEEGGTT
jgi:hypothetical protein